MSNLVIDIETVGPDWDEIDEPTRIYLTHRMQDKARRDGVDLDYDDAASEAADRLALDLGMQRIVAIGLVNVDTGRDLVLCDLDEAAMLREFWSTLSAFRRSRIITFNGRVYDGPVLMVRSAQLGIVCTRNLVPYRYDISEHCDLADVLGFQGTVRSGYTLDYWCRRFGIESPKSEGVSGADVAQLFRAGRMDEIAAYVRRDIHATADLYRALTPLLHTVKGGPQYDRRPDFAREIAEADPRFRTLDYEVSNAD